MVLFQGCYLPYYFLQLLFQKCLDFKICLASNSLIKFTIKASFSYFPFSFTSLLLLYFWASLPPTRDHFRSCWNLLLIEVKDQIYWILMVRYYEHKPTMERIIQAASSSYIFKKITMSRKSQAQNCPIFTSTSCLQKPTIIMSPILIHPLEYLHIQNVPNLSNNY